MGTIKLPDFISDFHCCTVREMSAGTDFKYWGDIKMKLITFDFEGTLVDFQWNLDGAVTEVIAAMSREGIGPEVLQGMNYAAIYNFIKGKEQEWGFADGYLVSIIGGIYDKYDLDAASRWRPVDDLAGTLRRLDGYRLALVSNIGRIGLAGVLPKFGLEQSFSVKINRNDVKFLKPDPEGLLHAIAACGAAKDEVIHIGDSLADLYAARNAGVKVGIILGGENKPEVLLREEPDLVIDKFSSLPDALNKLGL